MATCCVPSRPQEEPPLPTLNDPTLHPDAGARRRLSRPRPTATLLAVLALALVCLLLLAAPVALAQGEDPREENLTSDNAPQESAEFEDEAGQVYGASILLAMVAIGIVVAVVLVKQHWRHRD